VLRVLADGVTAGQGRAVALSYARAEGLLEARGRVTGVAVVDLPTGRSLEVEAKAVVSATGAWADRLRADHGRTPLLRPLRGSHLYLRADRLPLAEAVAFSHPDDHRPVFAYPWEGVTLVGTTDVDHHRSLDEEPRISLHEAGYLLRAIHAVFPDLALGPADVLSTQAGVRPVVASGKRDPSAESREHVLLREDGLLTVTGGKLTTFRPVALAALGAARRLAPDLPPCPRSTPVIDPVPLPELPEGVDPDAWARLVGRHGLGAAALARAHPGRLAPLDGTPYLEAELEWALEREAVTHLSDLLLRRLRCGILHADGGLGLLPALEEPCRRLLGWDEARWSEEVARFRRELALAHGLPEKWARPRA
jgi:glycerol-3-phosphate dehydrogenase